MRCRGGAFVFLIFDAYNIYTGGEVKDEKPHLSRSISFACSQGDTSRVRRSIWTI